MLDVNGKFRNMGSRIDTTVVSNLLDKLLPTKHRGQTTFTMNWSSGPIMLKDDN